MTGKFNSVMYTDILKWFIIFQPVLDILTLLSIYFIDLSITVGIVFRMLFMLLSFVYIFFGNDSPYKKYVIGYLILLLAVLGLGFLGNIFLKPTFNFFLETQWIAKVVYFIVMFCAFVLVFTSKESYRAVKMKLLSAVYIAASIVVASILLSILTNTSTNTYEWVKDGYKGWFYSGNELGAIIAITAPLLFIFAYKKTNTWKDSLNWLPLFALLVTGVLLGTKVGLFAMVGTLAIGVVILILHWLVETRKNGMKNRYMISTLLAVVMAILFGVIAPTTPSVTNLSVDMPIPEKDNIATGPDSGEDGESMEEAEERQRQEEEAMRDEDGEIRELPAYLDSEIVNKILSARHFYFTRQYHYYIDAHIYQQLFGMGYAGNYTEVRKTIEMDFLDIFFSFGVFGAILIFLPLIMVTVAIIRKLFSDFKQVLNPENIFLITSIMLGNGIALIAGHVWFAPSVSIYFSLAFVLLLYNLYQPDLEELSGQ
ncbi:O-antigen ligase family protein [Virgibacillus sediminis]|uniref:O-antigen ligase family protein n=1 Tax=Virgibacillus sediminis TaxID=202260 RepID=A0ABV7A3S2_9BACI